MVDLDRFTRDETPTLRPTDLFGLVRPKLERSTLLFVGRFVAKGDDDNEVFVRSSVSELSDKRAVEQRLSKLNFDRYVIAEETGPRGLESAKEYGDSDQDVLHVISIR